MRQFTNAIKAELSKKTGLDPTIFVGVEWNDRELLYSSHELVGTRKQIVNISGVETTQVVTGTSASQSVTVTLSDTDGHIREMIDQYDIHKVPAKVYMGFPGVPLSQAILLLDGEVNSDMVWDDRARTFTFTILNKIEGRQFGFAMEDGLFAQVNNSDRSKPWPFRFGETCAYPAVSVRNGIQGILRQGQGVLDTTLDAKICQAKQINCPKIKDESVPDVPTEAQQDGFNNTQFGSTSYANDLDGDGGLISDSGNGLNTTFGLSGVTASPNGLANNGFGFADNKPLVPDRECERAKFETLCQLLRDRANQLEYISDTLEILGGEQFPQGVTTRIRIGDVAYTGVFSGETFTIETTNRLDAPVDNVDCKKVGPLTKGYRNRNESTPGSLAECSEPSDAIEYRVVGGAGEAWREFDALDDSKFKWLPSGSDVYLEEVSTLVNIVSLVPGTITGVYAYRTFGNTQQLTELPTDYYTVVDADYGDLTAVEIHLARGLESYPDEDWTGGLYVHFDSDVGPNPADVIQWIVENFTDFTVDATTFADVHASLVNYPCNYYHGTKENVLATLNRIAYESRCALTITDNVVKIKYLAKEPTADKTFTEADLVAGSFSFNHGRTEDLKTSSDVTWQPFGADVLSTRTPLRQLTVERNVQKYGFFGDTQIYRTINNETQALKTATFWSIMDSNTWRHVKFQTTLEHMDFELFDTINLNIAQFPNVKVVVEAMTINPENGIVEFECWTPILSGTTEEYLFAWPALKGQELYPSNNYKVETPLLNITPSPGHPLYIAPESSDPIVVPTVGDRIPSDLDDVFPETICSDMNDSELVDVIAPQFKNINFPPANAKEQAQRADDVAQGGGLSFNFEEPEETTACGRPTLESCVWTVNVQYGTAGSIAPDASGSGAFDCPLKPGPCNQTEKGKRCSGPTFFQCRTFGSENMARAYYGAIQAQVEQAHCRFRTGQTKPVGAILLPIKGSNCPEIDQQVGSDGKGTGTLQQ